MVASKRKAQAPAPTAPAAKKGGAGRGAGRKPAIWTMRQELSAVFVWIRCVVFALYVVIVVTVTGVTTLFDSFVFYAFDSRGECPR